MKTFDQEWEQVHNSRSWGQYPPEDVIRFVARNRPKQLSETVRALDAGCGAGPVLWLLAREGFAAYGFDGSESAVASAKEFLDREGLMAHVAVCDAGQISFEDAFFDIAVDNGMVGGNSVEAIETILCELHRVLKPNGKFLSTRLFTKETTGFGSGEICGQQTFRNLEYGPLSGIGTLHFFREDELEAVWERAGFRVCSIDREFRTIGGGAQQIEFFVVESIKC